MNTSQPQYWILYTCRSASSAVFFDPLHLTVQDRVEGGEHRWQTIGQVGGAAVFLVAHTVTEDGPEPVETIRIISARRATPKERKRYANG